MFTKMIVCLCLLIVAAAVPVVSASARNVDIRGLWLGKARGPIFGAEGSVTITTQKGEEISGIVEGGNVFGTAKFGIKGTVRGNAIHGSLEGHIFRGMVFPDGTIRGEMKATNGEVYEVFLRKSQPYWGGVPQGTPYYGAPFGGPQGAPYGSPPGMPYGGVPYGVPNGIPYGEW